MNEDVTLRIEDNIRYYDTLLLTSTAIIRLRHATLKCWLIVNNTRRSATLSLSVVGYTIGRPPGMPCRRQLSCHRAVAVTFWRQDGHCRDIGGIVNGIDYRS